MKEEKMLEKISDVQNTYNQSDFKNYMEFRNISTKKEYSKFMDSIADHNLT
jgi:hypothetical protein